MTRAHPEQQEAVTTRRSSTSVSFEHDIVRWMQVTEGLSAEAYRVLHIILQLSIALKGPIGRNERGIAGRCNLTQGRMRAALVELVTAGLVAVDGQRIHCETAMEFMAEGTRRHQADRVIPGGLRRAVFERDGRVCRYCSTEDGPFEIDHIHPYSRGGPSILPNLTVSCMKCNRSKGDRTPEEWGA